MAKKSTAAQAEVDAIREANGTAMVPHRTEDGALGHIEPSDFRKLMDAQGWETQLTMGLEEGQAITGAYAGPGPIVEMSPDPKTGEIKSLPTHLLRVKSNVTVALLGSHKLNSVLPSLPVGTQVAIQRMAQRDTRSGNRVNEYIILINRKSAPVVDATATERA